MKKILIVASILFGGLRSFSQDDACKLILQNGLYKYYLHQSTGNFMQDIKTYFASDQFRSDYKNNKWGGTIGVVVDAIPISLGANADDAQLNTFQQKVRASTSFSTSSSFYDIASIAIPDVELAKVYKDCVTESSRTGFKVYPIVSGNNVTFMIRYKKDNSADPLPRVTFFQIKNGRNIQNQPAIGQVIRDNMAVTCVRNPGDDLTMILETDRKTATLVVPGEPVGFNKDFPVGTVIASYLNYDQFNGVTKNNEKSPTGAWSSQFSKYAPCDGRLVPNSAFVRAANVLNVPDLRGIFIRGLNQFDVNETTTVAADRMNPENKKVGDLQLDELGSHTHGLTNRGFRNDNLSGGRRGFGGAEFTQFDAGQGLKDINSLVTVNPTTGAETRPKNMSLYYYIRIN